VIALASASANRRGARIMRAIPAGLKLAGLALIGAGLLFVENAFALGGVFALCLVLAWAVGAAPLLRALLPPAFMLALAFVAHLVLGDWQVGLVMILRIGALLLLASVVSASTGVSEMLAVMDRVLAPLRWVGVATRPVGVACMLTLRFAPMLGARWQALGEAWRARSPRRAQWRLVTPFVISTLDDADRAADALAARGAFARDD